jgi:hypothetical protein
MRHSKTAIGVFLLAAILLCSIHVDAFSIPSVTPIECEKQPLDAETTAKTVLTDNSSTQAVQVWIQPYLNFGEKPDEVLLTDEEAMSAYLFSEATNKNEQAERDADNFRHMSVPWYKQNHSNTNSTITEEKLVHIDPGRG